MTNEQTHRFIQEHSKYVTCNTNDIKQYLDMSCDVYDHFVWTINVLQIYDVSFNIMVVAHAHTLLIWEE